MCETAIRDVVHTELWGSVKFLTSDDDLDVDGAIYRIVFNEIGGMDKKQQREMWKKVIRKQINKIIKTKRNNVSSDIRKTLMGTLLR